MAPDPLRGALLHPGRPPARGRFPGGGAQVGPAGARPGEEGVRGAQPPPRRPLNATSARPRRHKYTLTVGKKKQREGAPDATTHKGDNYCNSTCLCQLSPGRGRASKFLVRYKRMFSATAKKFTSLGHRYEVVFLSSIVSKIWLNDLGPANTDIKSFKKSCH